MDDSLITTFLAVTGASDESVAKQYLEITNNDLDYAVTLYMESNPPGAAPTSNDTHGGAREDDEAMAQRLQQEAYGSNDDVREADANIHRHETLIDSFGGGFTPQPQMSRPTDIFGQGRVGIFNQRFDDEENAYYNNRIQELQDDNSEDESYNDEDEEEEDDDDVMVLDSDGEVIETTRPPRSRRRIARDDRINELTSTQRRLANLFRPPFDLMERIDIDSAKIKGREEKKWILVNIQDSSEFGCQVLNRDFWSNSTVKNKVKENFIFLQYQNDSPNGMSYTNFYSTNAFPHISILDPLTGERVFKWIDGEIPDIESWIDDIDKFLNKFSLLPNSKNPIIEHEHKFDPDALTEEQQIEFALKQSMGNSADDAINIDEDDTNDAEPDTLEDPFDAIKPVNHEEPSSGNVTRIQIRFPNGKRLIHKFNIDDDKVITIYQWLKNVLQNNDDEYGLTSQDRFNLSNVSNKSFKLIESLDSSIGQVGLKNASILLEKE
ncbi:hypothetical protein HYPBUDRAFT_114963 [Hyphopichia burtonii NRRL Y-1933]|uniref:UBX domain-containing protein n=1 Tax=Hyphopichia burtonii NRRL Y-1933 TaxID=984485 RepID=A0A1E4RCA9_9ASCO|nr:hypothetical protein HYPBUDRAFT_114963 [Hyphopichia burtonii NRRL Y-1933]ODV64887.1 hypothetical protein HYPBUDRAFT_114963 [Hyphopichia burtonii NRRL Y-1933]